MFAWFFPKPILEEADIDKGMRFLLFDGIFAQTTLVLTTGAFVIGLALALGASNTVIGLLAAVGPVMQALQVPAIYLVERWRKRRPLTVLAVTLSRLALVGVAFVPFTIAPSSRALAWLLGLLVCHFGLGAVAACAGNSWVRDLIPEPRMESFFARRLALATLAGALASLLGGAGIDLYKSLFSGDALAYGLVFGAGAISGLVSVGFLSRVPEPRMPEVSPPPLLALLRQPFRDKNFRRLLIFLGWWNFAVNFAGPFFAVYLLKRLELTMTWVLVLSVLSQLCNVMFYGAWGRLAERFTNKSVLVFCLPIFFLTFLLWPFTMFPERHILTLPILVVIHIIGGISAAGIALCAGNLALKLAPYGKAAAYLAVNALISGAAATVAPILAGFAADAFEPYELRLNLVFLSRRSPLAEVELPTIDLKGLDFIFLTAFVFGLYSVHRLLAVQERGEVTEKVVRQAFLEETRRMVRQVSTVAGVRHLVTFPFDLLFNSHKR